jgi:hypothetical protein
LGLITKIQYKNFEPGEFTDERQLGYQDTVRIIENFPWDQQRDHLVVGPTCPSVTIEGHDDDFLKLGPYYEGKFVLYYLTKTGKLYSRSLLHFHDAYPFIEQFFDPASFDHSQFRQEHVWLQGKKIHFTTNDFHYTLRTTRTALAAILVGGFCLIYFILFTRLLLSNVHPRLNVNVKLLVTILPATFLILAGLFVSIFINTWLATRNKVMIISRGNPIFYFGDKDSPERFDKKDITSLTSCGPGRSRSNHRHGAIGFVRIDLNTPLPRSLYIPELMVGETDLLSKFSGIPVKQKGTWFAFIPR